MSSAKFNRLLLAFILSASSIKPLCAANANAKQPEQWDLTQVEQMPNMPSKFHMLNWKAKANEYLDFVIDVRKQGSYLPLAYWDKTSLSLQSYVGHKAQMSCPFGRQEGINVIPFVLSGVVNGNDMRDKDGVNFVQMCNIFFNKNLGLVLNNPNGSSGNDFWYDIYPGILYAALGSKCPLELEMQNNIIAQADKWYEATLAMKGNFNHAGYNFADFTLNDKADQIQRDSAAGIATIEYWAYKKAGNPKHLDAAIAAMDWYDSLADNPSYEILYVWGAYTAARLNGELGKNYDMPKLMNWCLDKSAMRGTDGWQTQTGTWGDEGVDGLMGNAQGYAFSMNGWAMAAAWAPIARYDHRFARAIGKWMVNMANNSRLFFRDHISSSYQSSFEWYGDNHPIPYEGLKKIQDGKSPFAGGDAKQHQWAYTDLSLYSGSHVGLLGGIFAATNNERIFKIDCLLTDFYHDDAEPTFLYFNTHECMAWVDISVGSSPIDLYDAVTGEFIKKNISGTTNFSLPAGHAAVIVLVPAHATIATSNGNVLANGKIIRYRVGGNAS